MTNRDLVQSPHLAARDFMVAWDQPDVGVRTFPGFPIHFGSWATALSPAPRLGGHNVEVLRALGRSDDDIAALLATGTIATAPPG